MFVMQLGEAGRPAGQSPEPPETDVFDKEYVTLAGSREGIVRDGRVTEQDGTLGEMFAVISASDMVLLLISDAAQTALHEQIFAVLRPGTTLGLSHGFLMGFLDQQGSDEVAAGNEIRSVILAGKRHGARPSERPTYGDRGTGRRSSPRPGGARRLSLEVAARVGSVLRQRRSLR